MTVEIHEPKVEALLQKWMQSGQFHSEEEAIGAALESAPVPEESSRVHPDRTGADLIAAFQACPYPGFMPEHEPIYSPLRDVEL
jgi:hypothetical protein